MDFLNFHWSGSRNNSFLVGFDNTKKPLYLCRPHRGVEQYPSTWLRTGYLPVLSKQNKPGAHKALLRYIAG